MLDRPSTGKGNNCTKPMHFFGNYSFGLIFMVAALVHFARRRPDFYWLWVIMLGGGIGAIVYLIVEALPDVVMIRQYFRVVSHRKRIQQLEVLVLDNPSAGNYEE